MLRTGRRTYPRYFRIEFAFDRVKYQTQPRPLDPPRAELKAQVIELRLKGWSFPTIARHLDISVGTAWNLTKNKA
ncbi:MAG: helix-turn-helix domain-containing protein [Anaerolineae bacterium]|nr:helix-turn-helix domain-containing protein [Anaerolineae bacterium]